MGTKTRGNENEGESYRVRTGSELTGVVSERVLTVALTLHKESRIPIIAFHLIIHPTFAFREPLFTFGSIHLKPFPVIHCLWSDCPRHINLLTADFLDQTLVYKWPDRNFDVFHLLLQDFFSSYYRAVTPYSLCQDLYPNSPTPPLYSFNLIPCSPSSSEDQ